jgi:hypothetical protein
MASYFDSIASKTYRGATPSSRGKAMSPNRGATPGMLYNHRAVITPKRDGTPGVTLQVAAPRVGAAPGGSRATACAAPGATRAVPACQGYCAIEASSAAPTWAPGFAGGTSPGAASSRTTRDYDPRAAAGQACSNFVPKRPSGTLAQRCANCGEHLSAHGGSNTMR